MVLTIYVNNVLVLLCITRSISAGVMEVYKGSYKRSSIYQSRRPWVIFYIENFLINIKIKGKSGHENKLRVGFCQYIYILSILKQMELYQIVHRYYNQTFHHTVFPAPSFIKITELGQNPFPFSLHIAAPILHQCIFIILKKLLSPPPSVQRHSRVP